MKFLDYEGFTSSEELAVFMGGMLLSIFFLIPISFFVNLIADHIIYDFEMMVGIFLWVLSLALSFQIMIFLIKNTKQREHEVNKR